MRSLRKQRGRFATACILATFAALAMLLSADWRDRFISPGPLAAQHGQLLERDRFASAQCAACHAAAAEGLTAWTASLAGGGHDRPTQSQLCMQCHQPSIPADLALAAHNLPADDLKKMSAQYAPTARPARDAWKSIACADCHREHQGTGHDLSAMSNEACQACHRQRYDSFAGDHPGFGLWPYRRRTRITFDHAAHQAQHFTTSDRPFDCRTCHTQDSTGAGQRLADYRTSCAECHDEGIATSVAQGIPMLMLPTLDLEALRAAGIEIGSWPEMATGDFDGRLPPAMKLLLAADPAARRAMDTLGPDFEFFDVDPDDPQHVRAAGTLAQAIRRLLGELSQTGPNAVRTRLQRVVDRQIPNAELAALTAALSVDTLRSAVATWLPDVDSGRQAWPEVASSNLVAEPPVDPRSSAGARPPNRAPDYDPAGAWSHDDMTFTIRYQPTSHADPVLASWLELFVSAPRDAAEPHAKLITALSQEFAQPTAPGLCISCHSIEPRSANALGVNWWAYDPSQQPRSFTKFTHGPHLLLPELADCTACHVIDTSTDTAASYADTNPYTFASEFAPMSKRTCAECHTPHAAGDRCQSCHHYHVEAPGWKFSNSAGGLDLQSP